MESKDNVRCIRMGVRDSWRPMDPSSLGSGGCSRRDKVARERSWLLDSSAVRGTREG
jgi:hypothetical protein